MGEQLPVDDDTLGRGLDDITGPCHNRLNEGRESVRTSPHGLSIIGLSFHAGPANIGAKEDVRCRSMRRFGWIGNLFVQTKWCRMRKVEDKAKANSSHGEPDERNGERNH